MSEIRRIFQRHENVYCAHCSADLGRDWFATGTRSDTRGQSIERWGQDCPQCGMVNVYDLESDVSAEMENE